MAYRLALPPALSRVHKVFHVSMLRKYVPSPEHIWLVEDVVVDKKFTYEERPEKIVDRKDQVLRTRTIPYVKVKWRNHSEREATWELKIVSTDQRKTTEQDRCH